MKYALIVIVPPEPSGESRDEKMNKFLTLAQKLRKNASTSPGVLEIHPHVWQIDLLEGLAFLSSCVVDPEVSSRVVFLPDRPEWIHNH
jgi:hypothetical protein